MEVDITAVLHDRLRGPSPQLRQFAGEHHPAPVPGQRQHHLLHGGVEHFAAGAEIVEQGAGEGHLALDVLDALAEESSELYSRLTYTLVEVSQDNRERQAGNLAGHADKIRWAEGDEWTISSGCLVSNELIDAFPVHVVEKRAGKILEVLVESDGKCFTEVLDNECSSVLSDHFAWLGHEPVEGNRAEVNLLAPEWMRKAGERIVSRAGLKKIGMELGSNSPVIVWHDADIEWAAETCVSGAFWAACCGSFLSSSSIAPAFCLTLQFPVNQDRNRAVPKIQPGDLLGKALMDYYGEKPVGELWSHSSLGTSERVPVRHFFRDFDAMPDLEKKALGLCRGKVLDIGCGRGLLAAELKKKGDLQKALVGVGAEGVEALFQLPGRE